MKSCFPQNLGLKRTSRWAARIVVDSNGLFEQLRCFLGRRCALNFEIGKSKVYSTLQTVKSTLLEKEYELLPHRRLEGVSREKETMSPRGESGKNS